MTVNPYHTDLGNRRAEDVIAATPRELRRLLDSLSVDSVDAPRAPGKWSAREIAAHLADCEIVFAFRLRQTLAEDRHMIQPFDQDSWARS